MGVLTQYENDISSGIDNDLLSSINKIGTDPLTTTAQTLSGAVNELDNDVDNLETKVGSATLTTTAQDCSGAINELNSKGAQVMTQAEYDALPASKLTDNVVRYISDGQSAAEGLWAKVGSDTLTTTAQTCSGAINELKSNLTQLDGLNVVKRITTPASVVSFSDGSNLPMYKLEIEIDNVSGCTEANVSVSPLNISQLYNGQIYEDGTWLSNPARITNVVNAQDNSYFLKKGTYTLDFDVLNQDVRPLNAVSLLTKDENYNIVDNFADSWKSLPFTFTLTQNAYVYFTARCDYININPSDFRAKVLGQTYNIEFKDGSNPITVYDGALDIITGLLTVNDTTPPTYYNLSPISATTLTGVNNIYCDTGNILEVDYTAILNFS